MTDRRPTLRLLPKQDTRDATPSETASRWIVDVHAVLADHTAATADDRREIIDWAIRIGIVAPGPRPSQWPSGPIPSLLRVDVLPPAWWIAPSRPMAPLFEAAVRWNAPNPLARRLYWYVLTANATVTTLADATLAADFTALGEQVGNDRKAVGRESHALIDQRLLLLQGQGRLKRFVLASPAAAPAATSSTDLASTPQFDAATQPLPPILEIGDVQIELLGGQRYALRVTESGQTVIRVLPPS